MAEILTESFCERCGTRYTFESPRQRVRLKGVKVLSRGLKNFVLSDGTSMDEAMAAARSETDREVTGHQLDAFHKTFNFCMSCRQYTCPDCWNEVEARCLSCAPHLGHEILPAPFPNLDATVDLAIATEPIELWATAPIELSATMPAELADVTPEVPADIRSKAAVQTAGLLRQFRPGQNLDAELDAYERDRTNALTIATDDDTTAGDETVSVQPVPAAETASVADAALTVDAAPTADAAASTEPQPTDEPAPAAPATASAASLTPPAEVAPPSADFVAQPTWQRVAPDPTPQIPVLPPVAAPASQPASAGSSATAEPEWPAWRSYYSARSSRSSAVRPAGRVGSMRYGPNRLARW